MALLNVANDAFSTLAAGITSVATSLTVDTGEGARFPASNFHITIGNEILLCSTRAGDVFTLGGRGREGTTATAHLAGAAVELRVTAQTLTQFTNHPLTTKGDISVFGTAKTRLPVGADGQALLADSVQPLGVRWGTPPAGITSGWELIRTGTFTNDTNITGLDGNADRLWMLIIRSRHTGDMNINLRFNNDTATNYFQLNHYAVLHVNTINHTVSYNWGTILISFSWGWREQFLTIMISPLSGQLRLLKWQNNEARDSTNFGTSNGMGGWQNTVDNISIINIITGTITAGEFFLFRRRV